MMDEYKAVSVIFVLFCALGIVLGNPASTDPSARPSPRALGRVHIPFLGLGPTCNGCPQHYCDDDPAIIHGFCCGCARYFDDLPVRCPPYLQCPSNTHGLCEDYEYMMHCCCD